MTLRTRLARLERQLVERHSAEPMIVIVAAPGTKPSEEYVQQKLAEAQAAGEDFVLILWPELEPEAESDA